MMSEPAALSVPYATLPKETYIRGAKFSISFPRILEPEWKREEVPLEPTEITRKYVSMDAGPFTTLPWR